MDREEQLTYISNALDIVTKRPIPNRCVPGADVPAYNWFFYGTGGEKTLHIKVNYYERQREQDGTTISLYVPLTSIAIQYKDESIPLAEGGNRSQLLSFDTSTAPKLTEVTGLVEALNAALTVPLRV